MEYKLSGGMKTKWISSIARGREVSSPVVKAGDDIFKAANSRAKAAFRKNSKFKNFYQKRRLNGSWGTTIVIWSSTPMTKKNQSWLIEAANAAGLRRKR